MARTIARTFDLYSARGIADFNAAVAELGREVIGVTRAERLTTGREVVRDLIAEYGGTAGVARAAGYEPGTKGYRAAQRSIQRHAAGEEAMERRTISPEWRERYEKLAPSEDKDKLESLEGKTVQRRRIPPGRLIMRFRGKIRVSGDSRNRQMPGGRSFEQIKRRYIGEVFADPMQGFADSYGISRDWGADEEQPFVQVMVQWQDAEEFPEEEEEEEEDE